MILSFSATGNSRFVADTLAQDLQEPVVDLFAAIREDTPLDITSETPYILVCPVYAWRTPKIVEEFLSGSSLKGNDKAYVLYTTCASSGNADQYAKAYFTSYGMTYMGSATFYMPGNYIAFMQNPDPYTRKEANARVRQQIPYYASLIQNGEPFPAVRISGQDRMYSDMGNPMFYRKIFNREGFYATDACIHCGKCAEICPVHNISLTDPQDKPFWNGPCIHCMACIHHCPTEAIEFRDISAGRNRQVNHGE